MRKVNKVNFLDNENERPRLRLSDDQVWQQIIKLTGVTNITTFQQLEDELKRNILRILKAAIKREQ